jgi:hypothetical protein
MTQFMADPKVTSGKFADLAMYGRFCPRASEEGTRGLTTLMDTRAFLRAG